MHNHWVYFGLNGTAESKYNTLKETLLMFLPSDASDFIQKVALKLELVFVPEKESSNLCFASNNDDLRDDYKTSFTTQDILFYIYTVLHSSAYKKENIHIQQIDYSKLPYPRDGASFWKSVRLGKKIRKLFLMEGHLKQHNTIQYPIEGSNKVDRAAYIDGKVYINNLQYFDHVPESVWTNFIDGFLPLQEWLKNHMFLILEPKDISTFQMIISTLIEISNISAEIDGLIIENDKV